MQRDRFQLLGLYPTMALQWPLKNCYPVLLQRIIDTTKFFRVLFWGFLQLLNSFPWFMSHTHSSHQCQLIFEQIYFPCTFLCWMQPSTNGRHNVHQVPSSYMWLGQIPTCVACPILQRVARKGSQAGGGCSIHMIDARVKAYGWSQHCVHRAPLVQWGFPSSPNMSPNSALKGFEGVCFEILRVCVRGLQERG